MTKTPAKINAGNAASSTKLNYQHLKKARKIAATLVTIVVIIKLILCPVAVSMAVILVATLVTILYGSFSSNHSTSCSNRVL